ncbi:MAG TPA: sugar transferase [Candidatus Saccharimonadales bacterium]|nr:sugar transferase [Candidatus Saccharimonadales bacterium]
MSRKGPEYIRGESKRALDLGVAAASLLLLSPALVTGVAISAYDTRMTPIFTQPRRGKAGKTFDAIKIRTMPGDVKDNVMQGTQGTFDNRASNICKLLRRSGLDEMPQLWNVIRGDMHVIGIRPMLQDDLNRWQDVDGSLFADYIEAYDVCPGLTGPDQLYRKRQKDCNSPNVIKHSMRLGIDYVENASLVRDVRILAQTVPAILGIISPFDQIAS